MLRKERSVAPASVSSKVGRVALLLLAVIILAAASISTNPRSADAAEGTSFALLFQNKWNPANTFNTKMSCGLLWKIGGHTVVWRVVVTINQGDTANQIATKVKDKMVAAAVGNAPKNPIPQNFENFTVIANQPAFTDRVKGSTAIVGANVLTGRKVLKASCKLKKQGSTAQTSLAIKGTVDPDVAYSVFDIFGSPSSGEVAIASNGVEVSTTTDGKTIEDIRADLVAELTSNGQTAFLQGGSPKGPIIVSGVDSEKGSMFVSLDPEIGADVIISLAPVGGIAELPDQVAVPLEAPAPSGGSAGLIATSAAAAAVAFALAGLAWYARRRLRVAYAPRR